MKLSWIWYKSSFIYLKAKDVILNIRNIADSASDYAVQHSLIANWRSL